MRTSDPADGPGGANGTAALLSGLRVAVHVGFAVLLALALVRALAGPDAGARLTGRPALALVGLTVVLAGVYLTGTVAERRLHAAGRAPGRTAAGTWLAVLLGVWALAVLRHPDMMWVAFPLFFVALHAVHVILGRPRLALACVAAMTVVVVVASLERGTAPGAVLGPAVGAAVAVVVFHACRLLVVESERQRSVAEQLRATRAELAASERHAGVLAERERLAREIHDTLTQGLASIVLVSRAAQDAVRAGDAPLADERLETVRTTAAENLAESRAFVRGLRAPVDGVQGGADRAGSALEAALEAAVRGFRARRQALGRPVEAELAVVGEPVAVGEAVETVLVRAAQSSLANVDQHARTDRCRITLTWMDGEVALDVADDGVGFDPEAARARASRAAASDPAAPRPAQEGTGVGLAGLAERVAGVGGRVDVESAPGQGCVVAVRIPVPRQEERRSA